MHQRQGRRRHQHGSGHRRFDLSRGMQQLRGTNEHGGPFQCRYTANRPSATRRQRPAASTALAQAVNNRSPLCLTRVTTPRSAQPALHLETSHPLPRTTHHHRRITTPSQISTAHPLSKSAPTFNKYSIIWGWFDIHLPSLLSAKSRKGTSSDVHANRSWDVTIDDTHIHSDVRRET